MTKQTTNKELSMVDKVQSRIADLENLSGKLVPSTYNVSNQLQLAWIKLTTDKDKNGKSLVDTCTPASVSQTLFRMCLEGMDISKDQCYFIKYGDSCTYSRSYFGDIALARTSKVIVNEPVAQVVYEGDEFDSTIDVTTGESILLKHKPNVFGENQGERKKMIGAYCIVQRTDGTTKFVPMSMKEIEASWSMSRSANSPAHAKFPAEMVKRTVIRRALKTMIKTTDDSVFLNINTDAPKQISEGSEIGSDMFDDATDVTEVEENQVDNTQEENSNNEPSSENDEDAPF